MRKRSVLNKILFSPSEVAERLSIPSKKVISLCKTGKLPYFYFGDQIRVDADDLAAFIEASRARVGQCYQFAKGVNNGSK
jgi:excisionase family DNA binding protein